jgi:hypothetical protein
MRTIALAGALVAALAAAPMTAPAADGPNRARQLALPASAFPPGVVAKRPFGGVSAAVSGWNIDYHYRSGGRPHLLIVAVTVWRTRALAATVFKQLTSDMVQAVPKLKLPGKAYGDEQASNHSVPGGSQLIVRKGTVVWMLEPQTYLAAGGKKVELTRAQTIALYEKYGRLQQRRIG